MNKRPLGEQASLLSLIGAMTIFGTIGIFRKYIALPSGFVAMARGLLGTLFLLAVILFRRRDNGEEKAAVRRSFLALCFSGVMIGRGLIGDPGMLTPGGTTAEALEGMFNAMLEEYMVLFGGSRNAMFRLKEHWGMLIHRFRDSEKLGKRLRKTTDLEEYKAIVREIFHSLPLK